MLLKFKIIKIFVELFLSFMVIVQLLISIDSKYWINLFVCGRCLTSADASATAVRCRFLWHGSKGFSQRTHSASIQTSCDASVISVHREANVSARVLLAVFFLSVSTYILIKMTNMSNDETFKFLDLYQVENCLWNPKNKSHKNKKMVST